MDYRTCLTWSVIVGGMLVAVTARCDDRLPVVYRADFETGELDGWTMTDASVWKLARRDGGKVLALTERRSNYHPKVRSPLNIALIDEVLVTDFSLDVAVKSTLDTGNHRDLCLFFGYQDPEHFYYVHLGKRADPHAHSIFLVDGEPRVSISEQRTDGTPWDDNWHHVRIVRDTQTGDIDIYFDNMKEPIMHATDKHFTWGKVGVGSFDDQGEFDDLILRGVRRVVSNQ